MIYYFNRLEKVFLKLRRLPCYLGQHVWVKGKSDERHYLWCPLCLEYYDDVQPEALRNNVYHKSKS